MIRGIFKTLMHILFEIISFIILIPVLLVSSIVLLATGKFRAFVFHKRKEKPAPETSELVVKLEAD